MKPKRRRYLVAVAAVIYAVLLGNAMVTAQEYARSPKDSEQQSPRPDERETIKGYPVRERQVGGPTDVEWDLDNSFPKRDSLLELILRCPKNKHP